MKNGVPFDVAFQLDDITRAAWSVIFSEMEGNKFDIDRMAWMEES